MKQRDGIKIFLDDSEKVGIDNLRRLLGMSQRELGTRVFRWFLGLNRTKQFMVLGLIPPETQPDYPSAIVAEQTAAPGKKKDFKPS